MRTSTRWILRSNRYTHAWDLGARATSVHRRTRAHTLVAPTIHLSKSKTSKVLRRLPLQGSSSSDFFPSSPVAGPIGRFRSSQGSGILSFVPPLSIGRREDFCPTFTSRQSTRSQPVFGTRVTTFRRDTSPAPPSTSALKHAEATRQVRHFASSTFQRCCQSNLRPRTH